jgi:hypothetical protein
MMQSKKEQKGTKRNRFDWLENVVIWLKKVYLPSSVSALNPSQGCNQIH